MGRDEKVRVNPLDVARASRPLSRGHPARAWSSSPVSTDLFSKGLVETSWVRERDAPATAGETPALLGVPVPFCCCVFEHQRGTHNRA